MGLDLFGSSPKVLVALSVQSGSEPPNQQVDATEAQVKETEKQVEYAHCELPALRSKTRPATAGLCFCEVGRLLRMGFPDQTLPVE
jgi:hypothetical protein